MDNLRSKKMTNGMTTDEFNASYNFVKELEFLNINIRTQSEIEKQPTYQDFEKCLFEYKNNNILNKDALSYTLTVNSLNTQILSMKNSIINIFMDTENIDYFNWDNLMKVIYRVEILNFRVTIDFNNCLIEMYSEYGDDETIIEVGMANGNNKLEVTFNSIVMFIEYYG